jgi:hypothetical protein
MAPRPKAPLDRFLAKVDKAGPLPERAPHLGPCWIWTGYTQPNGYGMMAIGSRTDGTRKQVFIHRWSHEHFIGPIPETFTVDHKCFVPSCARPEHLEAVPHRVNLLRGDTVTARNAAATHCPAGHPYEGDNLRVRANGDRVCKQCHRDKERARWQARNPNAATAPGDRTHCPQGHPYSGENLIVRSNGCRACRECSNARRRTGRPTGRPRKG